MMLIARPVETDLVGWLNRRLDAFVLQFV